MPLSIHKLGGSPLAILIPMSFFLNGFWLWWGLPNGTDNWATDSIAPLGPLAAAKHMFVDDWWNSGYYHKYPMGHFFVLMAAYAPYVLYLFLTGGLNNPVAAYPYGLSDPETSLFVMSLIANGVSAIMGVGIVVLVYLTGRDLFGWRGGLIAALIIALSPPFIFYAHTSNVDTPSLFWCALGLFAFARLMQGRVESGNYVLLGFSAGMAMATKEQVYGLFFILPFLVLLFHIRHRPGGELQPRVFLRSLFHPKILAGFGISVLTFVLATHLIFNWDGNLMRFNWRLHGIHPTWGTDYPYSPTEVSGLFQYWAQSFWNLQASMNPALFFASLLGLLYFPYKERWAPPLALALASYFFLVVAQLPFIRVRFVMELVLVLALFGGRFLAGVWSWAEQRSRVAMVGLGLLGIYSCLYALNVNYLLMRDARYGAEAWLQAHATRGTRIETYAHPTYLPRISNLMSVRQLPFTESMLLSLPERSPDYVILSSAHYSQFDDHSSEEKLLDKLLDGEFGYRPLRTFSTDSLVGPNMIPGLSPDIVVLNKTKP